jgi:hypothetical protein
MPVYYQLTPFVPQFVGSSGAPLSNGTLNIYLAGTTTPSTLYTDDVGTATGAVITLNTRGYPSISGNTVLLYALSGVEYKFVLKDRTGAIIYTIDDIKSDSEVLLDLLAAPSGTDLIGYGIRTLTSKLSDSISIFDYIPQSEHAAIQAGTSTYDCTDDIALAIAENAAPPGVTYGYEKVITWPQGLYCVKHIDVTATRDVWFWAEGYVLIKGIDSTTKKFVFGTTNYNANPLLITQTNNFHMGGPGQWEFFAAPGTAYEMGMRLEHFTRSKFEKVSAGSGYVAVTDATLVMFGSCVAAYLQYSYSNVFIECGFSIPAAPPISKKSYGLFMGSDNINSNTFLRCNTQAQNVTPAPYTDTIGFRVGGNNNIFDNCDTSAVEVGYELLGRGHAIRNPYAEYVTRLVQGGTGANNDGCICEGGIVEIINDGRAFLLNNTQNFTIIGGYYKSAFSGTRYLVDMSTSCYGLTIISPILAAGAFAGLLTGTYRNPDTLCNTILQPKWITFPSTPQLSDNVNTLDDYEEGTFNATITFGGASVGVTYNYNSCSYTKIGNRVMVNGSIALTSKGSSVGNALITGLPFAVSSGTASYSAASLFLQNISFADVYQGYGTVGTTTIDLYEVTNAGSQTRLTNADFADNSFIAFSLTYKTSL